ncbi:MAG: glycosyltransferase family 4 protein [Planctomycetia bacterium]
MTHCRETRTGLAVQKYILILGLDTVAKKNLYQFEAMQGRGYRYFIISSGKSNFRKSGATGLNNVRIYESASIVGRLAKTVSLLLTETFCHVEIYPAGRLGFFYSMISRLFRVPRVVIERGDIGVIEAYPRAIRFSLEVAYRMATYVWYKEPYMQPLLRARTAAPLVFIPNGVPCPKAATHFAERSIDLVWANRLIKQRHWEWVVQFLNDMEDQYSRAVFAGVEKDDPVTLPAKVEVLGHVDLADIFNHARFFLLPADIVFGNYSLLEAMASGAIPVVTRSDSVERVIEDGVSGFVSDCTFASFRHTLLQALNTPMDALIEMSRNARNKIANEYSVECWAAKVDKLYLDASRGNRAPLT